MTRYLRITTAGFFVLLTLALIALWVRSYHREDIMLGSTGPTFSISSSLGTLTVAMMRDGGQLPWTVQAAEVDVDDDFSIWNYPYLGFGGVIGGNGLVLMAPYWFLTASSFTLAGLLAFKRSWRFTTRSLLIATALLAVALGLGVFFL
jgi:hypothetical protein